MTRQRGCSSFAALALFVIVALPFVAAETVAARAAQTSGFTAAQHINTLKVLRALALHSAEDPVRDGDTDFCTWSGIVCHHQQSGSGDVGAEVTVTQRRVLDLPADIESSEVRITALKVQITTSASPEEDAAFLVSLARAPSSTLTTLDFTGSNMTAELTASWGVFVNLRRLRLANNHFYGTLPAAWSSLTLLEEFTLQNNDVTGTLPPAWRTMTNLQNVTLDNNTFTGTLPPEWSTMTALSAFSLKGNAFCGGLPASWAAMPRLNVTADAALYDACVVPTSGSSNSDSEDSFSKSITTTTTAGPNGTTTTTEPPAVLTDCTTLHCVLCPVTAPSLCSACMPGYALTLNRTCTGSGRNSAFRAAGLQWLAGAGAATLAAALCAL
jgi:hypothetical protein